MDHKELRILLTEHFGRWLAISKAAIDRSGPLSQDVRNSYAVTADFLEAELADGALSTIHDDQEAIQFGQRYDVAMEPGTPLFEAFKRSYKQGHRDWAKAVLAYSEAAERFDFAAPLPVEILTSTPEPTKGVQHTLEALITEFFKYAKLERWWVGKTEGEKTGHFALLYEVLGRDRNVDTIGRVEARTVRDTLTAYPVNRNKLAATRGKPLAAVLNLPGIETLHLLTINKYLQTYNGLFGWAKRNGYCQTNPFEGLAVRTDRANSDDPRIPFSDEQLVLIRSALVGPVAPKDHHKWGALIGMHTGARLNEIAQLHLEDVTQIDGIWCFDINQKAGTKKQLKNDASKRVVPIHPKLMEYGFLAYLERMHRLRANDRLFPQLSHTKANGYGRNLGRWFNEKLLPCLHLKTDQLAFHSLRHTMVRKLIAADVSQAHIMAIVGHEPGTTTLKTYNRSGFPPALLLAALEKVM